MGKIIQSSCWDCRNETNHRVLFSYNQKIDNLDDNKKVISTDFEDYSVISCQGCNNVSFFLVKKTRDKKGKIEIETETFPYDFGFLDGDEENDLLSGEEITALPLMVRNVYEEIAQIILFKAPILTGIGLRTLLEAICIHQGIKGKNLMEKINNLYKEGFIAAKDLPILHNLREIGNVTVHQIKKPTEKTLHYSLEILKHTLRSLYVIPRFHSKIIRKKLI